MRASDYRLQARQTLEGNWLLAAGVTFVAGLLGSTGSSGVNLETRQEIHVPIQEWVQHLTTEQWVIIWCGISVAFLTALAISIFVSCVINMGYHKFHLNMIDGILPEFRDLFCRFKKGVYMDTVKLAALQGLYIFGLTLLFIIPGIIAEYSYAMSYYVMLDHPELTPKECMKVSRAMMDGNRWRLFCLEFSFIGWAILNVFTLGIGNLFLTPYMWSARTAFYRSICNDVVISECI